MSNWSYHFVIATAVLVMTAAKSLALSEVPISDEIEDDIDNEERFLIVPALTFNATGLLPTGYLLPLLFGALALSALSVAFSIGLGAVLLSFLFKYKYNDNKYYGNSGYSTGYEGHNSYRSFFDASLIDWENFSVTDMLHLGYETWTKYEPQNMDCQKRLLCELNRDTKMLGVAAVTFIEMFNAYLDLSNSVSLSKEVRNNFNEYMYAADAGRYLTKDCGDIYPGCKFSVSKTIKDLVRTHSSDSNDIDNEP